jgi:phage tail-like protein
MRRPAIERLLPSVYQRTAGPSGVLAALLDAMAGMHEPVELVLSAVDDLFAPYRAPDRMVAYLLGWVALDHVLGDYGGAPEPVPVGRLRDLLAASADIARARGTAAGLRRVIETVLGVPVTVAEAPDRPFHIVVRVPAVAAPHLPLIRRLVEAEKPAATTSEVVAYEPEPKKEETS